MSGLLMEQCLTKPPAWHSHLHIKMTLSGESAFNPIKNWLTGFVPIGRERPSVFYPNSGASVIQTDLALCSLVR